MGATLNEEEMYEYQQSLKEYQGMKNVIDTAFQDGVISMVKEMIKDGLSFTRIAKISGLDVSVIEKIAAELKAE